MGEETLHRSLPPQVPVGGRTRTSVGGFTHRPHCALDTQRMHPRRAPTAPYAHRSRWGWRHGSRRGPGRPEARPRRLSGGWRWRRRPRMGLRAPTGDGDAGSGGGGENGGGDGGDGGGGDGSYADGGDDVSSPHSKESSAVRTAVCSEKGRFIFLAEEQRCSHGESRLVARARAARESKHRALPHASSGSSRPDDALSIGRTHAYACA